MPKKEYWIREGSFCSDTCFLRPKPYFPECSKNVMPEVEYVIPQHANYITCLVATRRGKDNKTNKKCIQLVAHFIAKNHQTAKIIYIVHGWKEGRHKDWIYLMKDSIMNRYGKKKNVVVGMVFWLPSTQKLRFFRNSLGSPESYRLFKGSLERGAVCCASGLS